MNLILLMLILTPLVLLLAFALARIAIRLQQPPGLAALAAIMICWQAIAMAVGRTPLASSVTLLIAGAASIVLLQWLRAGRLLAGATGWAAYSAATLLAALAMTFPVLSPSEALAFSLTFGASLAGVWLAMARSRAPAPPGWLGVPSLVGLGLWLAVRMIASFSA